MLEEKCCSFIFSAQANSGHTSDVTLQQDRFRKSI